MNDKQNATGIIYFHKKITAIFIFMVFGMSAFMAGYWALILAPQLKLKAETTARSVVKANIAELSKILNSQTPGSPLQKRDKVKSRLGQILLLTDPESDSAYITGIELEIDHDTLGWEAPFRQTTLGAPVTPPTTIIETPVFSNRPKELIGIIKCRVGTDYIESYLNRIRLSFYFGAFFSILLILCAWVLVGFLMMRVRRAEKLVLEKQTQIIHAGRLTAMGEMATGIAHELNQPLAIIRLAADGLNRHFDDSTTDLPMEKKAAEKITDQVERAAAIINNMRSFARTGHSRLELSDIKEPILKAISFFREQFRIHDISLETHIPDDAVIAMINPQRFEQVVVNLLTNARYALDKKEELLQKPFPKHIAITLGQLSDTNGITVLFEVADNGIGMTAAEKERCLEPFFTTRGVGEGTGLGLSIVHTILKEHEMTLTIDSVKDDGSSFRITLPAPK